jgi:hypothetical protein
MSNFTNSRRGPNVSQYIADLNTYGNVDSSVEANFNADDNSLDLFTTTQFLNDFDVGNLDFPATDADATVEAVAGKDVGGTEIKDLTFDQDNGMHDASQRTPLAPCPPPPPSSLHHRGFMAISNFRSNDDLIIALKVLHASVI